MTTSGASASGDASAHARSSNWNVPNAITVVRIIMAPIFIWMVLADGGADGALRWWSAVVFIVAIATDGIDGHIARSRGIVTDLGKLLDPIADKVLTGGALVALSILGELPWWVTIVILVREVGITVHRFIVVSDHVVAAAWMGKLKTVVQAVAISLALLPFDRVFGDWVFWVNGIAMAAALILTVASGIDYVITAVRGAKADRGAATK
ncbi:CDP-diacylglycerol--glycerol-3-phosphate 3-phosphatidyltransferase [Plantibacter sp. Mn2098]|uniref:CDP-diacylglycerol--glycerol-3-phosphate 3-phosphatidyltransferase n=1 Tax=Plantibacter sp. Mn2098 TaxID=3395266 RepID=UPI003BC0B774